jgi:hypothetical protein
MDDNFRDILKIHGVRLSAYGLFAIGLAILIGTEVSMKTAVGGMLLVAGIVVMDLGLAATLR